MNPTGSGSLAGSFKEVVSLAVQEAFQDLDLLYPYWHLAPASSPRRVNISPRRVFITRKDVRSAQVHQIMECFEENPEKLDRVHVNRIERSYFVSQDGNHRVVAARLMNRYRIRAVVTDVDYFALLETHGLLKIGSHWCFVAAEEVSRGTISLLNRLPDGEEGEALRERLLELGFRSLSLP
jgi:hypothetical protein